MSENFAELFEQSLQNVEMRPGAIITGTVVDIDNEVVVVDEVVELLIHFLNLCGIVQFR